MKTLFLASMFSATKDKFRENITIVPGMKAAFIPTAADKYDVKPWMDADRQALVDMGMDVEDVDLKGKNTDELYSSLKTKDIIFVSGGNSFYLLYYVNQSGFNKIIDRLLNEGKIYIGSSAGSVLVGPTVEPVKTMDDPLDAPNLKSFEGLNLVDFVILPHYGKEKYEQQYQDILKEWSGSVKIQLLKDDEAVFIQGHNFKVL